MCLLVHHAKTDEPIEMSFGGCALVGPRNHGGHDLPKGRGTLGGSIWACADFSAVNSLNLVRKAAAAMQPLAQIIVATCFFIVVVSRTVALRD